MRIACRHNHKKWNYYKKDRVIEGKWELLCVDFFGQNDRRYNSFSEMFLLRL